MEGKKYHGISGGVEIYLLGTAREKRDGFGFVRARVVMAHREEKRLVPRATAGASTSPRSELSARYLPRNYFAI